MVPGADMTKPINDEELAVARDWASRGLFEPPQPTVFVNVGAVIARLDAVTAERDALREGLVAVLDDSDGTEGWSLSKETILLLAPLFPDQPATMLPGMQPIVGAPILPHRCAHGYQVGHWAVDTLFNDEYWCSP